ncbi:sensor domain-containing diguanylate cyclase [Bowmanella denitrificans]|uniref:sensor domain-containing diguanylate cyclase n=1 Tax=Bowmanella denitrificans TaxID=366582 RepID=UPI000C9B5914|nr:sensor domain-containing diguanylate cyclase [Bowmanella denitrificans]
MNDFNGVTLHTLLENANIGVVIHRWDTSVVYANPTALRLLRLSHDQIIGKTAMDPQWRFIDEASHPLPYDNFPVSLVKRFKAPLSNEILGVIDSIKLTPTWFMVNAYPEFAKEIDDSFIIVTFNDISDQKNLFSFSEIVDNAQDVIIVTEADNIDKPLGPRIVYVNKAFELLTGYSKAEVVGETPRILQGKDTDIEELARIKKALANKEAINTTILNYSKTGHPYWLNINIFPLKNKYGEVTHFAALERDVTSEKYYAEQLESKNKALKEIKENLEGIIHKKTQELHDTNKKLYHHAYFDLLTKIPNRRSFTEQAIKQFSRGKREKLYVLTGLLDIDFFKKVNDAYGHDVGDLVLKEVAQIFPSFFRREDVYGRFGGEEFAFCILISEQDKAFEICERLREKVAHKAIELGDSTKLSITVSIGATVTFDDEDAKLEEEIRRADIALYEAKNSGRNRICINNR